MLLDEFSIIFDRPEKVKKLREYILILAVRGKLVEQDENDEPASLLLERIREEKDRLVKEKKIKKEKPLPEIGEDDIPYELPNSWQWVRLGDIVSFNIGKTPNRKNATYWENGIYPWVSISDMEHGKEIFNTKQRVSQVGLDDCFKGSISPKGTLIMSFKLTIGKMSILGMDSLHNEAIVSIYPHLNEMKLFLFKLLNGFELTSGTKDAIMGKTLNSQSIRNILIALPPLNEQKRIVEKVDYLMGFCDKLEAQLEKKVKYGTLSVKSALNSVSNCSSYEELEEALRFIIENFKDLTLADGSVGELKNAILSLAVKGKLVPQDESDEPASVLLERIREEKERLVKEKKIKKEKPLPEIGEDEIPYELPNGWEWIRLGAISKKLGAGSTPSGGSKVYTDEGIKFIRSQNVYNDGLRVNDIAYIPVEINERMKGSIVEPGDILLNITGGSIGRSCLIDNNFDIGNVNQHVSIIRLVDKYIKGYIHFIIISPYIQQKIMDVQVGVSREGLSMTKLSQFLIPLPPLDEQKRIVEKVDKLMKVCDELQLRIEKSKKYNEQLMESILKDSLKA